MGQEVQCTARIGKRVSEGKAYLETYTLLFRGDFRLSIPLATVQSVVAEQGRLKVTFPEGVAAFDLGSLADKWAIKIRHPKSLIDKLGVKPDSRVTVLGVKDEGFRKQLIERGTEISDSRPRKDSDLIFFSAESKEDLKNIKPLEAYLKRNGAIWVVTPKGRQSIKEGDVIAASKEAGLVDIKVVSFSETHTALKLVIPLARR